MLQNDRIMLIQSCRGQSVLDNELSLVTDVDGSGRQQLRVERIELAWVFVRPKCEPLDAPNDLEGILEGVYDVISRKAVL